MDKITAGNIRNFVQHGGTVITTSRSATAGENGQIFATYQPGYLNDVFGIRIGGFGVTNVMNEVSRLSYKGDNLLATYKNEEIKLSSGKYDHVESHGADVLGKIISLDKDYPITTSNKYGKGRAIYMGVSANSALLNPIINEIVEDLNLKKGPDVPNGIKARQIDKNHILYFNMTGEAKMIKITGKAKSILRDKAYDGSFIIEPYEPEFIEL